MGRIKVSLEQKRSAAGRKGGKATRDALTPEQRRALSLKARAKLTPAERKAIAKKAAAARWQKQ